MTTLSATRDIDAPLSIVWQTLSDFGGVHKFSATVEASPITDGTPSSGVGAERVCTMCDGNRIEERVTASVEDSLLGIKIVSSSMPLKSAEARFDLVANAAGGTQVTMTMTYVVKFGLLGQLMDALMMKRAMTTTLGNILTGLGHHVPTGEVLVKGWKPAIAA